jgi:para-nitrobenzyl esterase
MSGQQVTASGPLNATARARAFLDALGLKPEQAVQAASVPAAQLVKALGARDPVLPTGGVYFGPVLDERTLTRHPFWPDAPPLSRDIPMIIGNTHDETRAFLGGDPNNFTLGWDQLPARLAAEMVADLDPDYVVASYRRLYPAYSPSEVFFAATTAGRSWRGHLIQAEARAAIGAPAWMYQLDFPSPLDGGRLRAFHTLDIPLVFDNCAQPGSKTGTGPDAQRLAGLMSDTFVAFARTGVPNHRGLPAWGKYAPPRRATMVFDVHSRMVDDPRGTERELFAAAPYLKPGT